MEYVSCEEGKNEYGENDGWNFGYVFPFFQPKKYRNVLLFGSDSMAETIEPHCQKMAWIYHFLDTLVRLFFTGKCLSTNSKEINSSLFLPNDSVL